jgi:hypothetical protein
MGDSVMYRQVAELAAKLSDEERRKLAEELLKSKATTLPTSEATTLPTTSATPSLLDFAGLAPYPLCGEDAQAWLSRTRREDDEHRERVLRGSGS